MKRIFALTLVVVGALALYMQWPLEAEQGAVSDPVREAAADSPATNSADITTDEVTPEAVSGPPLVGDEARAQEKKIILDQILKSRNDNDPRLDTTFSSLTDADKIMLKKYYNDLPVEDRNGRGTVVFLLSKSLRKASDLDFFREVLTEDPCLSLSNCDSKEGEGDPHLSDVDDVSKNYPQLVTLNRIENWLQSAIVQQTSKDVVRSTEDTLKAGVSSPVPLISNKAKQVFELFHKKFK